MTPEDLRRVRDLCVRRATTKLSLDEEHAVIYELANAAPWLLDELEARDAAKVMTTYRLADGELIAGEFGWVAETEWFDDGDDPVELVREVWQRVKVDRLTYLPTSYHPPCEACETEGELNGTDCPECDGEGYLLDAPREVIHPLSVLDSEETQ